MSKRSTIAIFTATAILFTVSVSSPAHHGTAISYDKTRQFVTKAVVTEFRYANPHPSIFFDVTDEKGNVVHWVSEMQTNISYLVRAGWTKKRSEEAMKPGAKVTLTIQPSTAGGPSGLVMKIEDEKGQELVQGRPADRNAFLGQ
jgi:hypothetical protein